MKKEWLIKFDIYYDFCEEWKNSSYFIGFLWWCVDETTRLKPVS